MKVVLGLGSNLGDREALLAGAVSRLEQLPDTRVLGMSQVYETEPVEVSSKQQNFLNCCVILETGLEPEDLLDRCLAIEKELGRVRLEYHGARTVDIDVLLCEGFTSDTEKLRVPHPGIRKRAFVLVPLTDLFPLQNAWGFDFQEDYERADRDGVWLYK